MTKFLGSWQGLDAFTFMMIYTVLFVVFGIPGIIQLVSQVSGMASALIGVLVAALLPEPADGKAGPITPQTYAIKRKPRTYRPISEDGKGVIPMHDPEWQAYFEANHYMPPQDSKRWQEAVKGNMGYFVSPDYPFDYIVMGDRAALEEARKGSFLTYDERQLICLGYGHDGRPFGEPWGIAEACLDGYQYGIEAGDFVLWMGGENSGTFKDFIQSGYGPFDLYDRYNSDQIAELERVREQDGEPIYRRLTPAHLAAMEKPEEQARRMAPVILHP